MEWTGIKYPFTIENGSVAKSSSIVGSKDGSSDHVNQSIELIVKTTVGEFLTRSYIGNKFRKHVFDSFSYELDTYLAFILTNAIEEQDLRVSISDISFDKNIEESKVIVSVKWDYNSDIIKANDDSLYETTAVIDI